jgi:serine/threonine-protein kinase RsbW
MGEAPGAPDPGSQTGEGWFAISAAGAPPVLEVAIDSGSLHVIRARVRSCAETAGLPSDRIEDAVLAIHELSANVVRHGGGTGRLRAWQPDDVLKFQVDNGNPPQSSGPALDGSPLDGSGDGLAGQETLPSQAGHGLWVVERIADQMQSRSGPGGTSVVVVFHLPPATPA